MKRTKKERNKMNRVKKTAVIVLACVVTCVGMSGNVITVFAGENVNQVQEEKNTESVTETEKNETPGTDSAEQNMLQIQRWQ